MRWPLAFSWNIFAASIGRWGELVLRLISKTTGSIMLFLTFDEEVEGFYLYTIFSFINIFVLMSEDIRRQRPNIPIHGELWCLFWRLWKRETELFQLRQLEVSWVVQSKVKRIPQFPLTSVFFLWVEICCFLFKKDKLYFLMEFWENMPKMFALCCSYCLYVAVGMQSWTEDIKTYCDIGLHWLVLH